MLEVDDAVAELLAVDVNAPETDADDDGLEDAGGLPDDVAVADIDDDAVIEDDCDDAVQWVCVRRRRG
jgi:hypothetical protein